MDLKMAEAEAVAGKYSVQAQAWRLRLGVRNWVYNVQKHILAKRFVLC
jgi:hypothetical protein